MSNFDVLARQRMEEGLAVKREFLARSDCLALVSEMAGSMLWALKGGGRVFFAGNGGSFADSIHLAAELVSRFMFDRAALAGVALGANNSIMSAVGNDYSYADVFARELQALAKPGDVFIGLSTSGNSENIIQCVLAAKNLGVRAYCLTGESGGKLDTLCQCLKVPSSTTARIQEVHITVGHILCEIVERELFDNQPQLTKGA